MGFPKEIYDKAWSELNRRKHGAREETQRRRADIHRRIPAIKEIERDMAASAAAVAKAVIAAAGDAEQRVSRLAEKNLSLQAKRVALLEAHGFAPDYLEEQYGCSLCRDKGYVGNAMCGCLRRLLEAEAYASLSQSSSAVSCTFDNFSLKFYPDIPMDGERIPKEQMAGIHQRCRQYASEFSPTARSLLFMGNTGLGKTHLSLAIAGEVIAAGYGVIYTPVQRLLDTLETEKFSRSDEARERYSENTRLALNCDLLVLDDLGTEFITSFSSSVLYNIINTRLIEHRPTIISTNLRIQEIEQRYSQRMVSRFISGYDILQFVGNDIRVIQMTRGERH